jgi:hypothetical protein
MRYATNLLIAIDQCANALLGAAPDETLSARAHRLAPESRKWAIARRVINGLFFWQQDHCLASFESEQLRRQLPAAYMETKK